MNALPSTGEEARRLIRSSGWLGPTAALAPGFVQANLVVLPSAIAEAFEKLCQRNPKPLPLLERTARGSAIPRNLASNADLRTDLPRYRVYRDGVLTEERTDLITIWQPDWVGFLLGCSFTFDSALEAAGIRIPHLEADSNVPMYITNRPLTPAGNLKGPLVVSMRSIRPDDLDRVSAITASLPLAHGTPIHIGSPDALGIELDTPDFGDPPVLQADELPVFWACGVTSQAVALQSRLPLMVTHAPGHMFITDLRLAQLRDLR